MADSCTVKLKDLSNNQKYFSLPDDLEKVWQRGDSIDMLCYENFWCHAQTGKGIKTTIMNQDIKVVPRYVFTQIQFYKVSHACNSEPAEIS